MQIEFGTKSGIESAGFTGSKSVEDLRATRLQEVPKVPGVYLVLTAPGFQPEFLERSVGGHFKGQDPTVPISELSANWVDGAIVLYVGKGGGSGLKATLKSRLSQYLKFGAGKAIGHRGGRYIWQLRDSNSLFVSWMPTPNDEPRDVERLLICAFRERYGKRPFANLSDWLV